MLRINLLNPKTNNTRPSSRSRPPLPQAPQTQAAFLSGPLTHLPIYCAPRTPLEVPLMLLMWSSPSQLYESCAEFMQARAVLSQPLPQGMTAVVREAKDLAKRVFGQDFEVIAHQSLSGGRYVASPGIAAYDVEGDFFYLSTELLEMGALEKVETYAHEFRHRAVRKNGVKPNRGFNDLIMFTSSSRNMAENAVTTAYPSELKREEADAFVTGQLASISLAVGYDYAALRQLILSSNLSMFFGEYA